MAGKIRDNERKLQQKVITPTASSDTPIGKQKKGVCPKNYTPYEFNGSNKHREQVTNVLKEAGFTRRMVETKVADILLRNVSETKDLKTNPSTSNFDLIIIAVVEAAQRNADTGRLDNLLEKIFGKTVHISGSVDVNASHNVNFTETDSELVQRALERAIKNNI